MSDSYDDSQQQAGRDHNTRETGRGGFRGGRGGNRESSGFRIRLSDNEIRAARALQDAFHLRSTVAVLGFAVRTLGQMLEDGQLEELSAQQRTQGSRDSRRGNGARGSRRRDGGRYESPTGPRPDPFARPSKPQSSVPEADPDPSTESNQVDVSADDDTTLTTDQA